MNYTTIHTIEVSAKVTYTLRQGHTLKIRMYGMGKFKTWFYIDEIKDGLNISHYVDLLNDRVFILDNIIFISGASIEGVFSFYNERPATDEIN